MTFEFYSLRSTLGITFHPLQCSSYDEQYEDYYSSIESDENTLRMQLKFKLQDLQRELELVKHDLFMVTHTSFGVTDRNPKEIHERILKEIEDTQFKLDVLDIKIDYPL